MQNGGFPFKKRESPLSQPVKVAVASERVKYTATMDRDIRKRVKFASAKKEIQISQYIEEAVLEKMEREGD